MIRIRLTSTSFPYYDPAKLITHPYQSSESFILASWDQKLTTDHENWKNHPTYTPSPPNTEQKLLSIAFPHTISPIAHPHRPVPHRFPADRMSSRENVGRFFREELRWRCDIIGSCRCVYVCDLLVKKLVRVSYRTPYVVCGHIGNTGRFQCSASIECTCISTSVNTQAVSSTSAPEDYDRESIAIPDITYSALEAVWSSPSPVWGVLWYLNECTRFWKLHMSKYLPRTLGERICEDKVD